MTITSRYSNNADKVETSDDIITVDTTDRYRRNPVAKVLKASRDRIAECDREKGHVLRVEVGSITCVHCEAEWVLEGF